MCGQSCDACNSGGVGGSMHQVRLHLHFTAIATAATAAAEPQKLKKQAVWVRMHLQGRRGRERVVLSLRAKSLPPQKEVPKFAKFANFLNFSGASQKLNARKLIILIILAPRKK